MCGEVCVFINTNHFRNKDLQYHNSAILAFEDFTDNTTVIVQQAFKLLENLYRPNYNYKKIGITLLDLKQRKKDLTNNDYIIQGNLFTYNKNQKTGVNQSDINMKIVDNINAKMGKMTIFYGSQGVVKQSRRKKIQEDKWRMKSCYRSPFYTTNWNDILKVS